ncbi:MAG TPA: Na+/H+ antiporter NhaA, partial [Dehalococcoidia bacterium]|nr:Na+/H+ antiporter NhaA [Dehalococcoidia bacterium]
VFLLALAIADDIGAVLVIAVFYTANIDLVALAFAALTLGGIILINRSDVRDINVYLAAGAVLWIGMHESGVHATIGGVILGLMTPATHYYSPETFAESATDLVDRYRAAAAAGDADTQRGILSQIEELSQGTEPPLDRLERAIHSWVSFAIVPLFALANAGVHVSADVIDAALESDISRGAALGLVLGKPLGIFAFTWLAVRLKLSELPKDVSWLQIVGVGLLGGIGFTVALFIADLGFDDEALSDQARLGVLAASVVSGVVGYLFLRLTSLPQSNVNAGIGEPH